MLPCKKRGRPTLLGHLDTQVQLYLKKVRESGGVVSARIAIAAAHGIIMACDKTKLQEFGGHIYLNRQWAYSLFRRMDFVKRKATTSKSKNNVADFLQLKESFLMDVRTTVMMEEIPSELVLNWDQTGIKLVPSNGWTMEQKGACRVEVAGLNDKRQITAVFCGSLLGHFLPVQLIYKGKTSRCHPRYEFPSNWHITHSPRHWSTEETMLQYIEHIIVPYVEQVRQDINDDEKAAVVIIDNFKGQVTQSVNALLEHHNIHVCLLPPNTTDLLQPMDISVNKPAKNFIKNKFQEWYSDQIMKQLEGHDESIEIEPIDLSMQVLKELEAKWLVEMAEYMSDNPQFIVKGFIRSGITGSLDDEYDNKSDYDSESELNADNTSSESDESEADESDF